MPEPWILGLMMVIVLGAFVAKGATGFGESLILIPLFMLLVDIKLALPVALVVTAGADVYLLYYHHRDIHRPGLAVVLVMAILGVALGTWLLAGLESARLQTAFAVVLLLFATKLLFFDPKTAHVRAPHPAWGAVAGLAAGTIDALFGTGGPPLIIYLTWLGLPRSPFRATFIVVAFCLHVSRIVGYSVAGLFTREILFTGALLIVPMILGALVGRRLHARIHDGHFRKAAAVILLVVGVKLLL